MDAREELQAAAILLLEKAKNSPVPDLASAVDKATGAIRLPSDLEKAQAELRKLAQEQTKLEHENATLTKRERSDRLKDYVTLLTPIISILALATTVFLQGWQFMQSEKDKREAAEDTRWEATVKAITEKTSLSPTVIALNPFLKSARYSADAKRLAVQTLAIGHDPNLFTDLFDASFVPLNWSDFEIVLRLNRALDKQMGPLREKSYDAKTDTNDMTKLTPQEKEIYDYVQAVLPTISAQMGPLLTSRPADQSLNLSSTRFDGANWQGADLSGANIEYMGLTWISLRGADLDKITQFDGALFYHVAWWEAAKISPELLEYLEHDHNAQYKPDADYGPKSVVVKPNEYAAAIARLKAQNAKH